MTSMRLVPLSSTSTARIRLLCFHHAGGSAQSYRALAARLPSFVEVVAVELVGRVFDRDACAYLDVDSVVSDAVAAVRGLRARPTALLGHSLGALLAFETARHLERVAHVFVSARRPPDEPDPLGHAALHGLADDAFVDAVAVHYGGIPAGVLADPGLLAKSIPVLRADIALLERHAFRPGPPLPCALTALGGSEDRLADPRMLAGWQRQTRGSFAVRTFSGGHFYFDDDVNPLGATVERALRA
jgi:medium-chain acyl-[acyl-carrier-protein] hydrolase